MNDSGCSREPRRTEEWKLRMRWAGRIERARVTLGPGAGMARRRTDGPRRDAREEVPVPHARRVGLRPQVRGPFGAGDPVGEALLVRLAGVWPWGQPAGRCPHA